jgi:hypothetical protein
MKPFDEDQLQALDDIIRESISRDALRRLMTYRLKKSFDDYTPEKDYQAQRYEIVLAANQEGWHYELAYAMALERPKNERLIAFIAEIGLAVQGDAGLQALVSTLAFQDIVRLRLRLFELEQQVARVEITTGAGPVTGTGFLVGPDLLLTNYHVVEALVRKQVQPDQVNVRFDYKITPGQDGDVIYKGNVVGLAADEPVVSFSPYADYDLDQGPLDRTWPHGYLDFALLRLAEGVGTKPAGQPVPVGQTEAPPRSWIKFPNTGFTLVPKQDLFIVQHPQGEPLKVAFGTQAVIGSDRSNQRVRYRTNSEQGSSGSPCFNGEWKLVALHHSGDPNFWHPQYNQGIPVHNIVRFLTGENKKDLLTFV